jgi:hypothetical protein
MQLWNIKKSTYTYLENKIIIVLVSCTYKRQDNCYLQKLWTTLADKLLRTLDTDIGYARNMTTCYRNPTRLARIDISGGLGVHGDMQDEGSYPINMNS